MKSLPNGELLGRRIFAGIAIITEQRKLWEKPYIGAKRLLYKAIWLLSFAA